MASAAVAVAGKGRRPLVVLAGWLGSQPKSLRRYEELYKAIGIEAVVTRIAPPHAIVQSVVHTLEPVQIPPGWPEQCESMRTTVQGLAWDILRDVHHQDCSLFYVHAFSNGGCFVWEQLRRIMLAPSIDTRSRSDARLQPEEERTAFPSEILAILSSLRDKLGGVIFDSCPIAELNRIDEALKHCSWVERANVMRYCGLDYLYMKDDPAIQHIVQQRTASYVAGLLDDPLLIPQLYLYSRDDPLAPAPFIDSLVRHRRDVIGSHRVMRRVWDQSVHCSHLLKHPQDYAEAVQAFVELKENGTRSKL